MHGSQARQVALLSQTPHSQSIKSIAEKKKKLIQQHRKENEGAQPISRNVARNMSQKSFDKRRSTAKSSSALSTMQNFTNQYFTTTNPHQESATK